MNNKGFTGVEEDVWLPGPRSAHVVRRPDDGHQRAVLQLQGHEHEALGAVHRDRGLIALGIAVINIHPPIVLFALFWSMGFGLRLVYGYKKLKGKPVSVIATSTDEPDEQGLHH